MCLCESVVSSNFGGVLPLLCQDITGMYSCLESWRPSEAQPDATHINKSYECQNPEPCFRKGRPIEAALKSAVHSHMLLQVA